MSAPFSMRYSVQIAEQTPHFRLKMPRRSIAISAINSIGHFRDLSATSNNKGYRETRYSLVASYNTISSIKTRNPNP